MGNRCLSWPRSHHKMMGRSAAVLVAICLAAPAASDFDPTAYLAYETFALCHDLFGNSTRDKFPKLAGQKPEYLETQIRAFLACNCINDGGQLASIVTELVEEDIAVVVEWFSTQDPPTPADLPEGNTVPYHTAQQSAYLYKQMLVSKEGRRVWPTPPKPIKTCCRSQNPKSKRSRTT